MLVGYARVSTADQNPALQIDALNAARCSVIFEETACGADDERPQLKKCLKKLQPGDTLVVWKLDRLARSVIKLATLVQDLNNRGINFKSLTQPIDTTSPAGKLVFTVFAAIAEFERDMIKERVNAGIAAGRARGLRFGPPTKINGTVTLDEGETVAAAAKVLKVSRSTLYRALDAQHRKEHGTPYPRQRRKTEPEFEDPTIKRQRNNLYRLHDNGSKKRLLRPRTAVDPGSARHHEG